MWSVGEGENLWHKVLHNTVIFVYIAICDLDIELV